MQKQLRLFQKNEDGAVTVDWTVLTAAIVILGSTAVLAAMNGISGVADVIASVVEATGLGES